MIEHGADVNVQYRRGNSMTILEYIIKEGVKKREKIIPITTKKIRLKPLRTIASDEHSHNKIPQSPFLFNTTSFNENKHFIPSQTTSYTPLIDFEDDYSEEEVTFENRNDQDGNCVIS